MSTRQVIHAQQSRGVLRKPVARWTRLRPTRLSSARWGLVLCALVLSGCDKIGLSALGGPSSADVRREAEGRAIGGACRHAGRAIEDCFTLNRQADKAAIFAGWREMNDYMAEKSIAPVPAASAGGTAEGKASRQDAAADTGR